jgi:hypothetical protein
VASGIAVAIPYVKGAPENTTTEQMNQTLLMMRKLLGRNNFDIVPLESIAAARALTDTNGGKNPNAPYHSFILPYFKYYGDLDFQGGYLSALNTTINTDLTAQDNAVHYYISSSIDPKQYPTIYPGANGAGLGTAGASTWIDGTWQDMTVRLGSATAPFFGCTKLTPAFAYTTDVTPISTDANGNIQGWNYKNQAHFFFNTNTASTGGDLRRDTGLVALILWALGHIRTVRQKTFTSKQIMVTLDLDDWARQSTPAWYASVVANKANLPVYCRSAYGNGFGPVNLATEGGAVALNQAKADGLIPIIQGLQAEGIVKVHPHSHDTETGIVLTGAVDSAANGIIMYNLMKTRLQSYGLNVDPDYITNPGNQTNDFWDAACLAVGIKVMRGGDYVGMTQNTISPLNVGWNHGLIKTGRYEIGWVAATGTTPYNWDHVIAVTSFPTLHSTSEAKSKVFYWLTKGILFGSSSENQSGYGRWMTETPYTPLTFHPDSFGDSMIGAEIFNWFGQWKRNIFDFYQGVSDVSRIIRGV